MGVCKLNEDEGDEPWIYRRIDIRLVFINIPTRVTSSTINHIIQRPGLYF